MVCSRRVQVSRQQLSADWRKRLQVIQSKAADAWRSLPADVVSGLQPPAEHSGPDASSPDYFVACQVPPQLMGCKVHVPAHTTLALAAVCE